MEENMALNREIQEYARAVAEAVFDECYDEWGLEGGRRKQVDLDAIIASVPPPTAQHHDAPTCDGWWWGRWSRSGHWAILEVRDYRANGGSLYFPQHPWAAPDSFDRWIGPLLPPDGGES